MELKDANGKPIDTSKLDPAVLAVLTAAFGGITPQLKESMDATLKPLSDKLATLDTDKLNEIITKVSEQGNQKPADENTKPKSNDPAMQAVLDAITKLNDRIDKQESQTNEERESSAASARTKAYIEKHFPNLKGRDLIIAKISATKPKDDDAVKAALDQERQYLEATAGKDAVEKQFSANAQGEGGKKDEPDTDEADAKAKIEAMEAELKK
jgi:hypothetical protein